MNSNIRDGHHRLGKFLASVLAPSTEGPVSLVELSPHANATQRVTAERNLRKLAACLLGERGLAATPPTLASTVIILPAHRSTIMAGSCTVDHSLGRGTEAQVPPLSRKTRESSICQEASWTGIRPPTLPSPALPQKLHQIGDFLMTRPQCLRTM